MLGGHGIHDYVGLLAHKEHTASHLVTHIYDADEEGLIFSRTRDPREVYESLVAEVDQASNHAAIYADITW